MSVQIQKQKMPQNQNDWKLFLLFFPQRNSGRTHMRHRKTAIRPKQLHHIDCALLSIHSRKRICQNMHERARASASAFRYCAHWHIAVYRAESATCRHADTINLLLFHSHPSLCLAARSVPTIFCAPPTIHHSTHMHHASCIASANRSFVHV